MRWAVPSAFLFLCTPFIYVWYVNLRELVRDFREGTADLPKWRRRFMGIWALLFLPAVIIGASIGYVVASSRGLFVGEVLAVVMWITVFLYEATWPHKRLPPMARKVLVFYGLILLAGAVVGGVVGHGSASQHAAGAAIGLVVSMVLAVVAVHVLLVLRSLTHHSPNPPSINTAEVAADPAPETDVWRRVEANERIARRYLKEHDHHPPQ